MGHRPRPVAGGASRDGRAARAHRPFAAGRLGRRLDLGRCVRRHRRPRRPSSACLPVLAETTQARLSEQLPGYGTMRNPFDITGAASANPQLFAAALEAVAADPSVAALAAVHILPSGERGERFRPRLEVIAGGLRRRQARDPRRSQLRRHRYGDCANPRRDRCLPRDHRAPRCRRLRRQRRPLVGMAAAACHTRAGRRRARARRPERPLVRAARPRAARRARDPGRSRGWYGRLTKRSPRRAGSGTPSWSRSSRRRSCTRAADRRRRARDRQRRRGA